jgi:hypothetical protein
MRIFYLILVMVVCLAVLDLVSGGSVRASLAQIPESTFVRNLEQSYLKKEVRISGLSVLGPERVRKLLPLERSITWWHLNRETVLNTVREQPFIEQASIQRCSTKGSDLEDSGFLSALVYGLRCFDLRVIERSPSLITELKGESWLVARGGALLMPIELSNDNLELLRDQFGTIAILAGLERANYSPDLLQHRLKYAEQALRLIRAESSQPIERAEMLENGELEVTLRGLALRARFEYSPDAPERIKDEARRLKALLEHYKGREDSLKEVDLAFNNLAVVRTF